MERIKISDGDFIIVTLGGEPTSSALHSVRQYFEQWVRDRTLEGVHVMVITATGNTGIDVKILSVNNVFENEVLNK